MSGWGKSQSATPEQPKFGREHMRAVFERQKARMNRTPVRMALVGKENTCKTGLALDLAGVSDKKIITVRANSIMESNDIAALFLPRLVEERLDKTEADDFVKIKQIFEEAKQGIGA